MGASLFYPSAVLTHNNPAGLLLGTVAVLDGIEYNIRLLRIQTESNVLHSQGTN